MTRKSFEIALRKGQFGEGIVRRYLEARGFVVYGPQTEGAHAFDILAIKDKRRCVAIDVKSKARRNKYPDTGINERHHECYQEFSNTHKMPFWVFFVDEHLLRIYGNRIDELNKPRIVQGIEYPMIWHSGGQMTRYWPLEAMLTIHRITENEAAELKALSQRSHDFTAT